MNNQPVASDIDQYIIYFPPEIQGMLRAIRETIKAAAPEAKEVISYQIPTFKLSENLVLFAAYKNHIGFYPTPSGINAFKDQLEGYTISKGTVQFPYDKPIPLELIKAIVKFRVEEITGKTKRKTAGLKLKAGC